MNDKYISKITKENPISEIEVPVEQTKPIVKGKVVKCSLLNVRENPSRDAKVISLLSADDIIIIEEITDETFYKTELGYVMKDFIEII